MEVVAGSLYEAAALGLAEFRRRQLDGTASGSITPITVEVRPAPIACHSVPIKRVEQWVNRTSKSPAEGALKERLKQILQ